MPDSELTPEEKYRKAQEAEYSAFVATKHININGARAFNVGDPVPKSHVDRGIVAKDDVAKPGTKAGQAAVASNPTTESEG